MLTYAAVMRPVCNHCGFVMWDSQPEYCPHCEVRLRYPAPLKKAFKIKIT